MSGKFTITYGRTINLGNYQSERIELTREFDEAVGYPGPDVDPSEQYLGAFREVSGLVEEMAALKQAQRTAPKRAGEDLPF